MDYLDTQKTPSNLDTMAEDMICHAKALVNQEPTFVIRAQDRTASMVVEYWADVNAMVLGTNHPKILNARKIAAAMRQFPGKRQAD